MSSEDEEYQLSDSEEEYDGNEKQLLNKVRNRKHVDSDSEDEVLGVGASSESEDDDIKNQLAPSDIDDDEDDLPNQRAWGKDKRQFYKTDYVDADYGGFQGKDAHLAEQEEEEARTLQKQLAEQLDDDDFALDLLVKKPEESSKEPEEIIKTDISKLSTRQKLQILKKESPEFFSLVEDYQEKLAVAKDYLHPILQKYKKGQIPNCKAIDFVQTHYELILNYCTNISMYLLLKASKVNVQTHPIIKKLYQYRQLLLQLEPAFNDVIKPQIELILEDPKDEVTDDALEIKKKKKTLKIVGKLSKKEEKPKKKQVVKFVEEEKPSKKIKLDGIQIDEPENMLVENESSSDSEAEKPAEPNEADKTEIEKRAITYKMAKNKGLTPHRKKEQRNPRVKHKLKYRKAMIRRKGAVREPRKELSRYGGEMSGIKAFVSKSVKIKS